MSRSRRRAAPRAATILASVLLATVGWSVRPALAIMTEAEAVAATVSTETLDAPTGLAASAQIPLIVNLSWTATVDTRATGYQVYRSTTSGGPYTQIGTVTSRSTTTYQDLPLLPGTYYYVLKTYFDSWTSVNSNEASAVAL